jgi:hypothetical protein
MLCRVERKGDTVADRNAGGMGVRPYDIAAAAARDAIATREPEDIVLRAGGTLSPGGMALEYLGRIVNVELPGAAVSPELPVMELVLLLRYLAADGPVPAEGEWVGFHHLPGGAFYLPAYRRRGPGRIVAAFGADPERLRRAGDAIGAKRAALGDMSFVLRVFPKVEAAVVLHLGDEEMTAEADVLYHRNITAYLDLEDVAVLAGLIASRLARVAGALR